MKCCPTIATPEGSLLNSSSTTYLLPHISTKQHCKGMFDRVHTRAYRGYFLGKYRTEPYRSFRYGRNTLPNTPVRFGTAAIPYLTLRQGSVRTRYRYSKLQELLYECDTGIPGIGIPSTAMPGVRVFFGTASILVPETSVCSVCFRYRYPTR